MSELQRRESSSLAINAASGGLDRRTQRALERVRRETLTRAARVQGESIVQSEKMAEIDHLAREAMTGQVMLVKWSATLAGGDPFAADDLRMFSDLAKLGKAEILSDTIKRFSREGEL